MLTRKMIVVMTIVILVSMVLVVERVQHVWAGAAEGVESSMKVNGADMLDDVASLKLEDPCPEPEAEYVPDEIIVKFKKEVADILEEQLSQGRAIGAIRLSDSLGKLSQKYKVQKIEPVIKNFKANRQRYRSTS